MLLRFSQPAAIAYWYINVANLGEFHFRKVPRRSVATEPGGGFREGAGGPPSYSKKLLENRTLNGDFWGHFKLEIVNICYCLFAGQNVFTTYFDPQKYIVLSELICLMEIS